MVQSCWFMALAAFLTVQAASAAVYHKATVLGHTRQLTQQSCDPGTLACTWDANIGCFFDAEPCVPESEFKSFFYVKGVECAEKTSELECERIDGCSWIDGGCLQELSSDEELRCINGTAQDEGQQGPGSICSFIAAADKCNRNRRKEDCENGPETGCEWVETDGEAVCLLSTEKSIEIEFALTPELIDPILEVMLACNAALDEANCTAV